jgi:hypothetical protein
MIIDGAFVRYGQKHRDFLRIIFSIIVGSAGRHVIKFRLPGGYFLRSANSTSTVFSLLQRQL